MKNCLVTSLMGTFENDSNHYFDKLCFPIAPTTAGKPVVLSTTSGGGLTFKLEGLTFDGGATEVSIADNKYLLTNINTGEGKLYILKPQNVKVWSWTVAANDTKTYFDLSDFYLCPNIEDIQGAFMKGDLLELGYCTKLTNVALHQSGNVTGELKDFADKQLENGRSSGTCTVKCNGNITLNGVVVGNAVTKTITFSNGSYTIS